MLTAPISSIPQWRHWHLVLGLALLAAFFTACGDETRTSTPTTDEARRETSNADADADAERTEDGAPAQPNASEPTTIERPADLEWQSAETMAREALRRCKGTNLRELLAVSTDQNLNHRLSSNGDQNVAALIFGPTSWRRRAVEGWSGGLTVRLSHDEARVRFAELDGEEVAVVVLRREEGQWRFSDIQSHSSEAFERWGRAE